VLTVTAVVGGFGASIATAAAPPEVSMEGTGPQPPGVGILSTAALAQENCADNGRTTSTYEGGGPWCVNPWPEGKKNGGATAPGVTATTVKVIIYLPSDQMASADTSFRNQAGGPRPTLDQIYADTEKAYQTLQDQNGTYQLWGREPVYETVVASGPDEAAQRADAVEVIAKKPFMVIDMSATGSGGAPVFSSVVAAKKIVVASSSTDAANGAAQSPYRWNFGADESASAAFVAALVSKSLSGKKAKWAGDADLKSKTRAFGMIYPTSGFDETAFEKYLSSDGGRLTDKVSYDPAAAQAGTTDFTTAVTRFKAAGITSVVLFANPGAVTQILMGATKQDYHPEWIFTGYRYHDWDGFARGFDQEQMRSAFGVMNLGPAVVGAPTGITPFQWYWGTTQGNTNSTALAPFGFTFQAMHYAGPNLTANNLKKGLFAAPAQQTAGATIGRSGYGKTVGAPYDEYAAFGSDRPLAWWSSDKTGPAQATLTEGKGLFMYLNDGESLTLDQITKQTPKFFVDSASVSERNAADFYPGNVIPTTVPCQGCPSSGSAPTS
jgi:hypothetical protein